MGSGGEETSVSIPTYGGRLTAMAGRTPTFSTPWGKSTWDKGTNAYSFEETPQQLADRTQLETIGRSILTSLGITGLEREKSLEKWGNEFSKEALRTAQPELEQSLFARGLGGQTPFYANAVNDLFTKVATQAVLNRENLRNTDEQLKLSQLGLVYPMQANRVGALTGLQTASAQQGLNEEKLYQDYYREVLLPYLSTVNTPGDSGLGGALSGAMQGAQAGFMVGGPPGAIIGALAGGGLGYGASASSGSSVPMMLYNPNQGGGAGGMGGMGGIDLSWLANLMQKPNTSFGSGATRAGNAGMPNYFV